MNRLEEIFQRQRELMDKYKDIQSGNGFIPYAPHPTSSLDSPHFQHHLKYTMWCIVEELAEAMNAPGGWTSPDCWGELADAFHFLVELTIYVGLEPSDIALGGDGLSDLFRRAHSYTFSRDPQFNIAFLMSSLGMAGHALRNKPWKQKPIPTDIDVLRSRILSTFHKFIALCISVDMDAQALYELYMDKNAVNKKRQESNY